MNTKKTTVKKNAAKDNMPVTFVFEKQNYILMIVGVVVIALGFTLMYGKEDIYDFRKITLAPIVVMLGFVIEIFAIMHKPKA
jgi:cell division protein FtsL